MLIDLFGIRATDFLAFCVFVVQEAVAVAAEDSVEDLVEDSVAVEADVVAEDAVVAAGHRRRQPSQRRAPSRSSRDQRCRLTATKMSPHTPLPSTQPPH